jgi:hypothetical protein
MGDAKKGLSFTCDKSFGEIKFPPSIKVILEDEVVIFLHIIKEN